MKKRAWVLASLSVTLGLASVLGGADLSGADGDQVLTKLKAGEPLPHDRFVSLAKLINPSVVNISTTYLPKRPQVDPRFRQRDPFFDFFEQFMGPMQSRPAQSLGTGFIIRSDGLIITNNHVIEGADIVKVQLGENDSEVLDAKIIGRDPRTDVALIKIKAKKALPTAKLGSSSEVQVGEWVAAFGNPYGHGHTMTKGIISALGRQIDEIGNLAPFMQTDASINPGNSGGPLVDLQGHVIGVNTAIDPRAQGIGFAIPIDYVKSILPELEKSGSVKRGFLGVQLSELTPDILEYLKLKSDGGAFVVQVVPGSSAEQGGVKEYDVIVEFNGQKVLKAGDISRLVATAPIGKSIPLKVIRNNSLKSLTVSLGLKAEEQLGEASEPTRSYQGQRAPFNLGFSVLDYTDKLAEEFGLPKLKKAGPIVLEVTPGSPAANSGLAPGDVILDVNLNRVLKSKDMIKSLSPKQKNLLRVLKRGRVVLIEIRPD